MAGRRWQAVQNAASLLKTDLHASTNVFEIEAALQVLAFGTDQKKARPAYATLTRLLSVTRRLAVDRDGETESPRYVCPDDYDVYLLDMDAQSINAYALDQRGEINRRTTDEPFTPQSLTGNLVGIALRPLVRAIVRVKKGDTLRVLYLLVDTGSPYTFFTEATWKCLGMEPPTSSVRVEINAVSVEVGVSHGRFADIDLAGANFLFAARAILHIDYPPGVIEVRMQIP